MDTPDRIIELADSIARKEARAAELARELAGSLRVRAVWPDAFANGCSVTLCATEVMRTMQQYRADVKRNPDAHPPLKRAFFRRSDGVEFDITSDQFWQLKKDADYVK